VFADCGQWKIEGLPAGMPMIRRFLETLTLSFELDAYDRNILALLQQDARLSYSEIGRRVHLSSPAVAERIRRLEEARVIEGFSARLNLRALGYSFETFVNITVDSHDALDAWAAAHAEVLALHATTGNHCALLRIALRSPEHLESLLKSLANIGKTSTAMVLSTQFEARQRLPADEISSRL
jgi:Lrp/AsnC family leucine-responsive transcriptional regulator